MSLFSPRIGIVCVVGMVAAASPAQDYIPGTSPMDIANTTMSYMNTHINNITLENMTRKKAGKGARRVTTSPLKVAVASGGALQGVRLSKPGPAALSYTPDPKIRTAAKQAFVDRIAKLKPELRPQLKKAVNEFDFFAQYDRMLAEDGYVKNNVADALTSCIVATWVASRPTMAEPNDAGQRLIRARVATALLADPRMKSAATRQRLGDEMQMMTVFFLSGYVGAVQQGKTTEYNAAMSALFRGMVGVDPKALALTSKGFVRA